MIIKWFKEEQGRENALWLRNKAEDGEIKLLISAITLPEVARGLKKAGWKKGEIHKCLKMLDTIIKLLEIEMVDANTLVAKLAQEIVVEFNLYSADAVHLASAILSNSDLFVSADSAHLKDAVREYSKNKGMKVVGLSEL